MSADGRERATDLLADRALQGLDPAERAELDVLLARHPELDDSSFDLAAARIALAAVDESEPLPEALRAEIGREAAEFFASREERVVAFPARPRWIERAGWLAAAASLAIASAVWLTRPETPRPGPPPSPPLTIAQQRERLAGRPDTIRIGWTATKDPDAAGAEGDVVWNGATQTGYMRFRGLPANDPAHHQYQLWIFDANQDARYPIDGGVFDVPSTGDEVLVPIDPKLKVASPTLFAITEEKPGGVVVSSRERLVLLAKV